MPDKKQPFCWKCASKIETLTKDDSFVLDGCIAESKIKCYDDAKTMCPLIFPQENKVIIIIVNGAAQIEYKPDDIEIEIRDYDIEGGDPPEERPDCKKDNVGDWYQEMIFPIEEIDLGSEQVIVSPAKKIKFSADGPSCFTDVELKFHNYYRCPTCGNTWEDEWDCMCDDECGECGCSDISPYKSVDIPQSIGWQPSPADYPLAGLQTFEVYEDLEMGKGCHPEVKNWIEIFEGMIEKPVIIPTDKEDENKTITILQHTISYFLRDTDMGIEIDESSTEHIEYMIGQGYCEGDLSVTDFNRNITYHGYWKIVK